MLTRCSNTQWNLTSTFPLAKPDSGVIISIASIPPSSLLREVLGADNLPFFIAWFADIVNLWYKWKLLGTKVKMEMVSGNPGNREDLEAIGEIIATGKVKSVMRVVQLEEIDAVREACTEVSTGKGGIGKLVIKISFLLLDTVDECSVAHS